MATAGELLRRALADGAKAQRLAKEIVGSDDGDDLEVENWRHIVMRAKKGGEPEWPDHAMRVGLYFGETVEEPPRRGQPPAYPAALEEQVDELVERLDALTNRVRALERRRRA